MPFPGVGGYVFGADTVALLSVPVAFAHLPASLVNLQFNLVLFVDTFRNTGNNAIGPFVKVWCRPVFDLSPAAQGQFNKLERHPCTTDPQQQVCAEVSKKSDPNAPAFRQH